ncbi:SDR family oxidoreductase [Microbacterium sp. NPDC056569]|uniref:SDR family oxidoreductase n=1 Tax=Microbacterium sp. NPDC056569 TaxID=3345867 RepID=UPI0036733CDA
MTSDSAADPRVVWVIGGGSGVGLATAIAASESGWRVVVSGRREETLAETVRQLSGEAAIVPFDIAAGSSSENVDRAASVFGRLDAVVVSSGMNAARRTWLDLDIDETEQIIQTNLIGPTRILHAAVPHLVKTQGSAVIVSSRAAWRFAEAAGVGYGASKTALSNLVQTFNAHTSGLGIRATHLCPGDIDTAFLQQRAHVPSHEQRAQMLAPEDVAASTMHVLETPKRVRIDELVINPRSQP